jgi:hypothetical protein
MPARSAVDQFQADCLIS